MNAPKKAAKKAAKKRVGRPPLPPGERRRAIDVTLPAAVIEQLRELGEGNVSRGIEIAIERVRDMRAGVNTPK